MADSRLRVQTEGIDAEYMTLKSDGVSIVYDASKQGGCAGVGLAVTLSADDTVALAADGDAVYGKLILVEFDGFVSVQRGGVATLPAGAGATVTRGSKVVGALGASNAKGYIRNVNTATVAELGKCRGCILNVGDTTKVGVDLG